MGTNKHKNQHKRLFIISFCVLLVIVIIGVNLIRSKYLQKSNTIGPTPVSVYYPIPTFLQTKPNPFSLEKGNWKKYTNAQFGFSFQYPAEWKLYTYNEKYFPPAVTSLAFLFDGAVWRPTKDTRYNGFEIIIYPNPQRLSPEDWIRTRYNDKDKLIKISNSRVLIGNAANQIVITDSETWAKTNNLVRGPGIGQLVQSAKDSSLLFDFWLGGDTFLLDVFDPNSPYKAITSSFYFSN